MAVVLGLGLRNQRDSKRSILQSDLLLARRDKDKALWLCNAEHERFDLELRPTEDDCVKVDAKHATELTVISIPPCSDLRILRNDLPRIDQLSVHYHALKEDLKNLDCVCGNATLPQRRQAGSRVVRDTLVEDMKDAVLERVRCECDL